MVVIPLNILYSDETCSDQPPQVKELEPAAVGVSQQMQIQDKNYRIWLSN